MLSANIPHMISAPLYRDFIQIVSTRLPSVPNIPEETPDRIVHALWLKAAGVSVSVEYAGELALPALDHSAIAKLRELVARRLAGVPISYLTGRQRFMGLELHADPGALIPRKETELLCRSAIDVLRYMESRKENLTVMDVCTGSGNLAVALAHYVPQARVFASDLSPKAVEVAGRNARYLELDKRVEIRAGDLFAPFENPYFHGNVDLITCNPPYISSGKLNAMPEEIIKHEPRLAFDGGPFGINILNRFIQDSPRFLRRGGWAVFEVGLGQGRAIFQRLAGDDRFRKIIPLQDGSGRVRGIMASR
jgi:release factor glutamine methyltransferase